MVYIFHSDMCVILFLKRNGEKVNQLIKMTTCKRKGRLRIGTEKDIVPLKLICSIVLTLEMCK